MEHGTIFALRHLVHRFLTNFVNIDFFREKDGIAKRHDGNKVGFNKR